MAMTFPVREILSNPEQFVRGGGGIFVAGMLVVTRDEALMLDDKTDHQLLLDPRGSWRNWLPREIPEIEGEYTYLDEAYVAGYPRVEANLVIWTRIWQVNIRRAGKWLLSEEHF